LGFYVAYTWISNFALSPAF